MTRLLQRIAERLLEASFTTARRPPISALFLYTTLFRSRQQSRRRAGRDVAGQGPARAASRAGSESSARCTAVALRPPRSEEHTSELQSHGKLVCRLLHEKKNHVKNADAKPAAAATTAAP